MMKNVKRFSRGPALTLVALLLPLLAPSPAPAFPLGRVTFRTDTPFKESYGHSAAATGIDSLFTVAGWADTSATVPANLWQWWWIYGVDSGVGNGALIDGSEAATLQFDKGVGAAMINFLYTGGIGGTTNNLARINIAGFTSNPGATAVTWNSPRISNLSYAAGTLSFDYLNDNANDYGQLMFSNPAATAGQTLIITGGVSTNGDASNWGAALYQVDVQEAYAGPALLTTSVPHNTTSTYTTPDGALTVRGFADTNAVTPANLGRYQDECFGVFGGEGDNVVDTNESLTMQFAPGIGLARLDSIYSGQTVAISGFLSDPGLIDPSFGTIGASYADGTLTFNVVNGGWFSLYFTNRAASAGQTLRINCLEHQFGLSQIGYADLSTLIGPDIENNISPTYTTPDGKLTLAGYADTPGTVPANLYRNVNWFGVAGGINSESIEGAESINLQFTGGAGLNGLATRYTTGSIVISGFTADPGFSDPSGIAQNVSYSAGTLTFNFDAPKSPEVSVAFTNLAASINQTLSLHTGGSAGDQLTLTRIDYSAAGPVTLAIQKSGGNVVLTWPSGTLQSSTNATAFYSDIAGATSPYTDGITGGQKFFRVKVQ